MIRELLHSRAFVAALGCVAVVGLLGTSVVSVQALAPQEPEQEQQAQQEHEEQQQATAERETRHRYRAVIEHALQAAREAMGSAKLRLHKAEEHERGRLHAVQERLRMLQEDMPRRLRIASPRIELRSRWGGGGWSVDRVLARAEDLGLTDDQVAELRDARRAHRRADIERDADIEVAELDLEDLLEDDMSADLGAVQAKMQEIANLRVAGRIADLQLRQQVHGLLTAEQRDELEESAHGVYFSRGDGPQAFFYRDGGLHEFEFSPEHWFESFELDGDRPFIFEWKSDDDESSDDEEQDESEQGVSSSSAGRKAGGVKTL